MLNTNTQSAVTTLEMNHGKVNAMDLEFCTALIEAIREFERSSAECLVFRSTTRNRVFSAGIDLKRISKEPISYTRKYFPQLIRLFEHVYYCRKPTLAIVEGPAIAGGCVMAVGCTSRVGTKDAAFGMPNKRLDVPIPQIAPLILQTAVPADVAGQLHSESLYTSQAALDSGVLCKLAPVDQLENAIVEVAFDLSANPMAQRERDASLLRRFQIKDQSMIDAWCDEGLRARISEYINSL